MVDRTLEKANELLQRYKDEGQSLFDIAGVMHIQPPLSRYETKWIICLIEDLNTSGH
jgi:hypothetical protein